MKKNSVLSLIIFLIACLSSLHAARYKENSFTPIQISIWDGIPNFPAARYTNGLRLGLPYSAQTDGIEETINGVDLALFSQSCNINGVQIAFVSLLTEHVNGVQIGFYSMGERLNSVQMNMYNFNEESNGLQLGAANVGGGNNDMAQIALANFQGRDSTGFQMGLIDYCDKFEGFQLGILNISSDASSDLLQIGLINYCENGFLPFFPFFNFSVFEGRESPPRALEFMSPQR